MRRRPTSALCAAASWVLLGTSCIVEAPSGQVTPEKTQKVLRTAPPLTVNNGAVLGNKVKVVAARFEPGQAPPGEPVKVSLQLQVLEKLDKDYLVFVHIEDPQRPAERLNADHRPAGGEYPTSQWKAGETVRDDFQIFVPPNTQSRALNVWAGFWEPEGDSRLALSNPDQVRNDGQNRILLATLPVARP